MLLPHIEKKEMVEPNNIESIIMSDSDFEEEKQIDQESSSSGRADQTDRHLLFVNEVLQERYAETKEVMPEGVILGRYDTPSN